MTVGFNWLSFLLLIILALALVISALVAIEYEKIANMKGHFGSKYFWFCFFLGPVGWFMIHALPDRGKQEDEGE